MDSSNPQLQASVFAYRPDNNDAGAIQYSISVTNKGGESWILEKRYSAFDDLQKKLRDYLGETVPKLPKKSYLTFLVGKSHDDIEQRRIGLDTFIKALIKRTEVVTSDPFKEFLEIDKHAKEIIVTPPQMVYEFTGFLHGIRDFAICPEQGVMFIVNSDCSVMTRLDAYITNMKAPWESENGEDTLIPVGCVECWLAGESGEFARQWTKMYNSQAMCCYWDPAACVLLVGLDSGSINYLSVPLNEGLKRFDESMEIEQHLDRVMGVYFDKERQLIHSIAKDRKYRVLSMQKESLVTDLELGSFELTYLLVNQERKKSFIADRCGSIYIFDLTNIKPVPVVHMNTAMRFVRGLHVDSTRNYLFAVGFEAGDITVFDINKPGKEQYTKEVTKLEGRVKSREICWAGKRGEIFVGNIDGTVTIWDAKKASPIYVIKAHEGDVTKIIWLEADQTLLTAGKDKKIKAWRLPQNWRDQNIVEKEVQRDIAMEKQQNIEQLQKKITVKLEDDDEDDMIVWHKQEQREHNDQFADEEELGVQK